MTVEGTPAWDCSLRCSRPPQVAQFCIEVLVLAGIRPFAEVFTGVVRRTPKSACLHS